MTKVLIVEDDREGADAMRQFLEFRGFQVSVAGSAEAAMDVLEQSVGYDVVITDLQLPGIRGEELAQQLIARLAHVPKLIALSGENMQDDGGPFDLRLRKPCKPRVLADAITALLDNR